MTPAQTHETHALVGWQPAPSQRGTVDIVESCILTIIACTWTIHHPNVPPRSDRTILQKFFQQIKWMVVTVLIPELILAQALDEYLWVRKILKKKGAKMKSQNRELKWSKKHCYYGNMGGFQVEILDHDGELVGVVPLTTTEAMSQLETSQSASTAPTASRSDTLPISVAQIDRMTKRDAFTKAVAILQILWVILSCTARLALHRSTSQLEIITFSFAVCAIPTYILRWDKPQNIEIWTPIEAKSGRFANFKEPYRFSRAVVNFPNGEKPQQSRRRFSYFRNDTTRPFSIHETFLPSLILLVAAISGLHFIAWNFSFPSEIEQQLWRWAGVASVATPLSLSIFSSLIPRTTALAYKWH